jgi:hypothetical protein
MKDPFFYKLNCRIDTEKILEYELKNRHRYFTISGFDMCSIPKDLIKDHPLIDVMEKFHGIPYLSKMEPWSFLDFHIDNGRLCNINSLLLGYDSHTYFTHNKNNLLIYEIIPVDYTLGNSYLFNTKEWHAVVNRTERRVNLSISFSANTYNEVLEYCQKNNL